MRNAEPTSQQQNERPITRGQEGFPKGAFDDLPGSGIPRGGVKYAENYLLFEDRAEPRGGCKQWGDYDSGTAHAALPTLATGYTWTISGVTVTKTVGTDWTAANVGDFLIDDNGLNVRIATYINADSVTIAAGTAFANSSAGKIGGPVNLFKFHKSQKKIILQIDVRFFVASDIYISSWIQIFPISYYAPQSTISVMTEMEHYAIVFNAGGIFKLDLSLDEPLFYRMNTTTPIVLITQVASSDALPYKRKYLYSESRISGSAADRDRTTDGSVLELQSGPNAIDSDFRDYGIVATASPIGEGANGTAGKTIGVLTHIVDPSDDTPLSWPTHYSVFSTMDIGINGINPETGDGNNKELFIWSADVPVAKAFVGSVGNTGIYAGTAGTLQTMDIGSLITSAAGESYLVSTVTSGTAGTLLDSDGTAYSGGIIAATQWEIGGGSIADLPITPTLMTAVQAVLGTETMGKATVTRSAGHTFVAADVGKPLFWANGLRSTIVKYLTANTAEVAEDDAIAETAVTMDPVSRNYHDVIRDSYEGTTSTVKQLASRAAGFSLRNRYWVALPDCDIGVYANGVIFGAVRGEEKLFFSQALPKLTYLGGYYNNDKQEELIQDEIRHLSAFPDWLMVYGARSRTGIPINTFSEDTIPEVGEVVVQLAGKKVFDDEEGLLDYGSVQKISENQEICITSENKLRIIAPGVNNKTPNLAQKRLMKRMRKMEAATASIYDKINGYVFWGNEPS